MAVGNDSVKSNLVEVRGLKLQHLVNASAVDLVCGITDFLRCAICTTEAAVDELLTILVKEVESGQMCAS